MANDKTLEQMRKRGTSAAFRPMTAKAEPKQEVTAKEKPTSIWMTGETKTKVKALSAATGRSVSAVINEACEKYLKSYKMTDDEKIAYDAIMRKLLG